MRLIITDTADDVAEWSAKYVKRRINEFKPGPNRYFVMGLPTGTVFIIDYIYILILSNIIFIIGSTPLGMYKKLIEYHKAGKLSFKYVKTFNMDEYVNLPREHPESYHFYMWNNFFKHIDIDPQNAHVLNGNADDLVSECNNFEKQIVESGGIELFIGGINILWYK